MSELQNADESLRIWRTVLLPVCAVLLLTPSIFFRDLWHIDEVRYVEAARQMDLNDDYVLPRLNGEVYGEKPPLFFWGVLAFERICGDYILGARLWVLCSMLVTVLAIRKMGQRLGGSRRHGDYGALFFLMSAMVLNHGQRVAIDPVLVMWTTLAAWSLAEISRTADWRCRLAWQVAAVVTVTAACMTKGPVGVFIPIIGGLIISGFLPGGPHQGWRKLPLFSCLLALSIAAAVTLGWLYVASQTAGEAYWNRLLYRQSIDRAVNSWAHAQPWYFFLLKLPPTWLPAFLFLPIAALCRNQEASRIRGLSAACFAWLVVCLVIFSAISGKRAGYMFPLLPAFCLCVASSLLIANSVHARWRIAYRRLLLAAVPFLAAIAGVAMVAAIWLLPAIPTYLKGRSLLRFQHFQDALPAYFGGVVLAAGLALLLLGHLSYRRSHWQTPSARFLALVSIVAVAATSTQVVLYPALNTTRSVKSFVQKAEKLRPKHEAVVVLGTIFDPTYQFYTRRHRVEVVLSKQEVLAALAREGRLWIVVRDRDWSRQPQSILERCELVFGPDHGNGKYYLVREL